MFSIRKDNDRSIRRGMRRGVLALAAAAALLPAVGGCAKNYQRPVDPANNPTDADPALAYRNWPLQDAQFANSKTTTYRNRFPYDGERASNQSAYAGTIVSPIMFFGQSLFLPISFILHPPGSTQVQSTVAIEPTFTANPSRPELPA